MFARAEHCLATSTVIADALLGNAKSAIQIDATSAKLHFNVDATDALLETIISRGIGGLQGSRKPMMANRLMDLHAGRRGSNTRTL